MFSENRPILHRKELFVSPDYPAYRKFKRLSGIEERKGLYRDTQRIGFENGWNAVLAQKGHYLKGHRLLSTGGETHCVAPKMRRGYLGQRAKMDLLGFEGLNGGEKVESEVRIAEEVLTRDKMM